MGFSTLLVAAVLSGGAAPQYTGTYRTEPVGDVTAHAELVDFTGNHVGTVDLEQLPTALRIHVELFRLPKGLHAFHIHSVGQCRPTFEASGFDYDPLQRAHGVERTDGAHAGDLPNLHVPDSGEVEFELFTTQVTLHGTALYVAPPLFDGDGAAFVIHEGADDYHSQPEGNAGPIYACGELKQ